MDVPPPGAALAAAGLNLRQEGSRFEKFKRSRTALAVVAGVASEVSEAGDCREPIIKARSGLRLLAFCEQCPPHDYKFCPHSYT